MLLNVVRKVMLEMEMSEHYRNLFGLIYLDSLSSCRISQLVSPFCVIFGTLAPPPGQMLTAFSLACLVVGMWLQILLCASLTSEIQIILIVIYRTVNGSYSFLLDYRTTQTQSPEPLNNRNGCITVTVSTI